MDIVQDILNRIKEASTVDADRLKEVEAGVRRDWGGDRVYIPAFGELSQKSERDRALLRDWRRGERVAYLARKYRISTRRARQIINGEKGKSLP